jgi:hypothetical protein
VASSKGFTDTKFREQVTRLAWQADQIGQAVRTPTLTRPWQTPDTIVSTYDIAGITAQFDRNAINAGYATLVADSEDEGTAGDAVGMKTQLDYLAGMERAYRARHASPIRCLAHAGARRKGHGHAQGIFRQTVLNYPQDAIRAGAEK